MQIHPPVRFGKFTDRQTETLAQTWENCKETECSEIQALERDLNTQLKQLKQYSKTGDPRLQEVEDTFIQKINQVRTHFVAEELMETIGEDKDYIPSQPVFEALHRMVKETNLYFFANAMGLRF